MSALLHKLGRWCADHAGRVVAAWLLVIVAFAGAVGMTGVNLSSAFTINGAESMDGLDVLSNRLPEAAGTSEQILFTSTDGPIDTHRSSIDAFVTDVSQLDGVAAVTPPFGAQADPAAGHGGVRIHGIGGRQARSRADSSGDIGRFDHLGRYGWRREARGRYPERH